MPIQVIQIVSIVLACILKKLNGNMFDGVDGLEEYRGDRCRSGGLRRKLGDRSPPGDGWKRYETGTDPDESDEVAGSFR